MRILNQKYYKMSNAIFSYGLTPIEFSVYSYLVCCAGNSDSCWPSVKTIAANTNCSPNSARKAVQTLEQRGFVRTESTWRYHNGKSQRGNNKYFLQDLPPLPSVDDSWGTQKEHEEKLRAQSVVATPQQLPF